MDAFLVKTWQALISGLGIGSIYALIAQGYYVTFITTGALNFGQGEFLMMGALFGLTCYVTLGLPYALAVAGAVILVGLMGVGLERVAIRPVLRHALSLSWVLSTVAISIILKNAAVNIWGPEQIKFPSPFGDTVLRFGPAGIFPQELFIIVAAIGILVGGLVIGLLEQFFGIINSNLKEGITFLVILLILAVRPTGLMGKKDIEKV